MSGSPDQYHLTEMYAARAPPRIQRDQASQSSWGFSGFHTSQLPDLNLMSYQLSRQYTHQWLAVSNIVSVIQGSHHSKATEY